MYIGSATFVYDKIYTNFHINYEVRRRGPKYLKDFQNFNINYFRKEFLDLFLFQLSIPISSLHFFFSFPTPSRHLKIQTFQFSSKRSTNKYNLLFILLFVYFCICQICLLLRCICHLYGFSLFRNIRYVSMDV